MGLKLLGLAVTVTGSPSMTCEGLALQVADLLDAMSADCGIAASELRADGGAAANDTLMQIQADLLGTEGTQGSVRRPDMGLIAGGYVLDLQGVHQRLQVRAWDTELRLMEQVDFKWDPNVWYTMKLSVGTNVPRRTSHGSGRA